MDKAKLQAMCDEANRKCHEFEKSNFYLGSAAYHCGKLASFAAPELTEAANSGLVYIDMPSEYHAPRYRVAEAKATTK